MTDSDRLHRSAMGYVSEANHLRACGESEENVQSAKAKALRLEKLAALYLDDGLEPTRSELFQNAASLAVECGDYEDAKKLVAEGLKGNPPEKIAKKLRNVLIKVGV